MNHTWKLAMGLALAGVISATAGAAAGQQDTAAATARKLGTVKSINGKTLVLKPDSGADVNVTLQDGVRIQRVAPGEKDLKNAVAMTQAEIQVGDRMLVRGKPGDNDSILALSLVVIKAGDVTQK